MVKQTTFYGKVHTFNLKGKLRLVVDPSTIPSDIRDALCRQNNYWLPSIIGPNHKVAHYDMGRQGWRDMRHAHLEESRNATILCTTSDSGMSLTTCAF